MIDIRVLLEIYCKFCILNILLSFFIFMNNFYFFWLNGFYKCVIIFSYMLLMFLLLYCLIYKMGIVMEFLIKECCFFLVWYFLMINNCIKKYIILIVFYVFKMCLKYGENCMVIYEFRRVLVFCVFFIFVKWEDYLYIYICILIYNYLKFYVFICNINILIEELFF